MFLAIPEVALSCG